MSRSRKFPKLLIVIALIVAATTQPASSQYLNWNGSTGDWFTAGNWTPNGPPNGGNGAFVEAGETRINFVEAEVGELRVGNFPGTDGTVRIGSDGALNTGSIYLGFSGKGTLLLLGGSITSDNTVFGSSASGRGFATVSGVGASWINNNEILLGDDFDGFLTITGGGFMKTAYAYFGAHGSGTGIATVSGSGSIFSIVQELSIAPAGSGSLILEAGGQTIVQDAQGVLGRTLVGTLGQINFGTGADGGTLSTAELVNDGVVHFNHTDTVTLAAPVSGVGNLTKTGSGETDFTAQLSHSGPTTIEGGIFTLRAGGSGLGSIDVTGALSGSPADALLRGSGTLALASGEDLQVGGGMPGSIGRLSPGSTSTPGNWSITAPGGLAFADGGRLRLEIGGTTVSDHLDLTGSLNLSSAGDGLELVALGGAWDGSIYTVMTFTGGRSGIFDNVVGLPANYRIEYGGNSVTLAPVPEPSSAAALLVGLAVLTSRRRRTAA